jgi:hypothetical protein
MSVLTLEQVLSEALGEEVDPERQLIERLRYGIGQSEPAGLPPLRPCPDPNGQPED